MSCYNTEKYVSEAIKSVINQTYKNWELIIINDGSTDNSLKVIKNFKKKNNKIKIIDLKKNYGQGYARNLGIKSSRGNWISILDADDIFAIDKLKVQSNIIKSLHKSYVLVGSSCFLINQKGKKINKNLYHYPKKSYFLKSNIYRNNKFPPHSSIVYKKSALAKMGLFDTRFKRCEDYDLWLRLSSFGNFTCTKKTFIKYRIHPYNVSTRLNGFKFSDETDAMLARVLHLARINKLQKKLYKNFTFNELLTATNKNLQKSFLYNKNKKLDKLKKNLFSILVNFENIKFIILLFLERIGVYRLDKIILKNLINNK